MSFLTGLAADLVEWLLSKVFTVLGKDYADWLAQRKADADLAANQAALTSAIKSGNEEAIEQAGANSLNNSGGN